MLNILTIHAMRKTSSLPKPLKTLLLSLAVSDLGVGLLVQPLYIKMLAKKLQQNTEDNPSYSKRTAFNIIVFIFSNASFFSVVAISVDRFLAIHLHLRYQELVTHKRVVALVISVWILSVFLSLIGLWATVSTANVLTVIILGLCFVCTTVIYCIIYFTVRRHTHQLQALQVQQVAQDGEMKNITRQRKSAVSTFYVYLVFLVCYLPNYCTLVASMLSAPSTSLNDLFLYSWTLVLVNSSLNPVIYCWKMRHIRHSIMDILRNIFQRQN